MENRLQASELIVLLHTHGLDLLAHIEAATRAVHEIQRHLSILRQQPDEALRGDALHAIRQNAETLLRDQEGISSTLREVQMLAAALCPERRRMQQFVLWDRRRRAGASGQSPASS